MEEKQRRESEEKQRRGEKNIEGKRVGFMLNGVEDSLYFDGFCEGLLTQVLH